MPLGNGDIAAGVYAIENGDLYLLLAKNDAYTYQGDIFKTGRVRVSLSPNPFQAGKPFRQTLDLATGSIRIEASGVTLRIWADANRPVYHVEIAGPEELTVTARPEFWKRFNHCSFNYGGYTLPDAVPVKEPTQDVKLERNSHILWYYAVGNRSIYADDLKAYNVESMAAKFPDPFRFNTFGNLLEMEVGGQTSEVGGQTSPEQKDRVLTGRGKVIDIRIHALTMQAPETAKWIEAIERQAAKPVDMKADWENHCRWWSAFWDRSWISVSDNTVATESRGKLSGEAASGQREDEDGGALVAQSYNVFRFLMACQSRGRVQAKFNGGLFTQQLMLKEKREYATEQPGGRSLTHEDDRLWGRRFTYQNQRLLYWPMLASGDFDLMKPFFDYYSSRLELRHHEGVVRSRRRLLPREHRADGCGAGELSYTADHSAAQD
jgi:Tfp pilus assembly protein FimT